GVTGAAATTLVPLDPGGGGFTNGIHVEGRPPDRPGEFTGAQLTWITPGYFATMGIPLLRGRNFDSRDAWRTPPAIVVNEAFVRTHLGAQEPIGTRVRIFNGRWNDHADEWWWTIAGVV